MSGAEKILWVTPVAAVGIGGVFFGMPGLILPLAVFSPFFYVIFDMIGQQILAPFGIVATSAHSYGGAIVFFGTLLGLVALGARAKDKGDARLSVVFLVLSICAYLFVCALLAPTAER